MSSVFNGRWLCFPPHRVHVQAQSLKDSILIFFTMLSVAHNDALTILLESLTLIPSLVVYLTHLTTPFREDDVELMASPSTITSYAPTLVPLLHQLTTNIGSSVRAISRTVVLLNYLVFSAEPTSSLRQKLQHAPHRQFNGISYLFIVTFGTLSYADPPEWVTDKDKIELEQIRGEDRFHTSTFDLILMSHEKWQETF